jgi:hypothetical protein
VVEKLVLRQPPDAKPETRSAAELIRRKIARRAAAKFQDGMNINLGTYIQMELLPMPESKVLLRELKPALKWVKLKWG